MIRTRLVGCAGPCTLSAFGDGFRGAFRGAILGALPGAAGLAFRAPRLIASNLDYDMPFIRSGTLLPGTR